jgi:hypothetical protein
MFIETSSTSTNNNDENDLNKITNHINQLSNTTKKSSAVDKIIQYINNLSNSSSQKFNSKPSYYKNKRFNKHYLRNKRRPFHNKSPLYDNQYGRFTRFKRNNYYGKPNNYRYYPQRPKYNYRENPAKAANTDSFTSSLN